MARNPSGAITDERVVSVLKLVVRGSGPVLDALTETDPLGWKQRTHQDRSEQIEVPDPDRNVIVKVKDTVVRKAVDAFYDTEFPGTAAWEGMEQEQRRDWWVDRVGRFTTLVVSVPGLGGVVADRFPVQDTLGAASQAMVLCAVARVHGVTDPTEQVRLLAQVLCRREVSRELVEGTAEHDEPGAEPGEQTKQGRSAVVTAGKALWRYGKVLRGIVGELDKRPQGGFLSRMVGKLPVVGIAGDYVSERSALKKAVKQAEAWIAKNPGGQKTLG